MKSKKIVSIWVKILVPALQIAPPAEQTKILERVKEFLARRKKGYLLLKILKDTERILAKRTQVEIILAHEQNSRVQGAIEETIAGRMGKEKKVKLSVDPELIGGFIAKTDDCLINASVRDHLNRLKVLYG